MEMQYRRMGDAGVKLSVLSFGSWVTFGTQMDLDRSMECMQVAYDAGVNFFDNAEVYAGGEAERLMGQAFQQFGWPRHTYLVSTKFFWGIHEGPNTRNTLNRKYLIEAIDQSLERLQLDHVDVVYCHRWGTSEWAADEIRAAYEIAERHHLRKPVVEQPQYNLLHRDRVEKEYARLYPDLGMGTTTWSPLASGILTGKYLDGVPEGSRAEIASFMKGSLEDADLQAKIRRWVDLADEVGCTPAQLALAWTAKNPNVSSVITGATRPEQVMENMAALEVLDRLDNELMEKIESVF